MIVVPSMDVVRRGVLNWIYNKTKQWIRWSFSKKEFESKFNTTNNNYSNCWDTSNGVY